MESYCRAKGWDLLETITESGCSGKDLRREGIQKVLSLCGKREIDVVVVAKLDRLTRHVADLGYLTRDVFTKNGVALASVAESIDATTATGHLMLNILGSDTKSPTGRLGFFMRGRHGEGVRGKPRTRRLGDAHRRTVVCSPRQARGRRDRQGRR